VDRAKDVHAAAASITGFTKGIPPLALIRLRIPVQKLVFHNTQLPGRGRLVTSKKGCSRKGLNPSPVCLKI
jgi:hypothetical protein